MRFSKIYLRMPKLQQKFTLFWIFPRIQKLPVSVANGCVSSKIYDKYDDFDFDIMVNFPFWDGGVHRRTSYGLYSSQHIRFARVCNHVADFNARNKCLMTKPLQRGYWYHTLRKTFFFFLNFIIDTPKLMLCLRHF